MPKTEIPAGEKRFRLTYIRDASRKEDSNNHIVCKCECGKYSVIRKGNFGRTKSCGCGQKEAARKIVLERNFKHGLYKHPLHTVWSSMIARCYKKKCDSFRFYGAKGITVCDPWLDKKNGFLNFYNWAIENGWQEGLSIDRIDPFSHYEPNNCRWATVEEQSDNKTNTVKGWINGQYLSIKEALKITKIKISKSQVRDRISKMGWTFEDAVSISLREGSYGKVYEHDGKSLDLSGWSKVVGISVPTLSRRMQEGWSIEEALTTPKYMKRGEV